MPTIAIFLGMGLVVWLGMRYTLAVLALLFPSYAFGETVYLDGDIDSKIIDVTLAKLSPHDTLVLNSQGGLVKDAYRLSEFVRANKIKTRVNSTGWCLSACVLIFAAGVERSAGKNALFLIHSARDENGKPTKDGTLWLLTQLMKYGVSERIAYLPVFNEDEMPINYVLAKYVGLVTD